MSALRRLGCPSSTGAALHVRGGGTLFCPVDRHDGAEFERVLDDTGEAAISVPAGADCAGRLRGVWPWVHELSLYRDRKLVWQGPVVDVDGGRRSLQITARDVTQYLARARIESGYSYEGKPADLSRIAERAIRDALRVSDPNVLGQLRVSDCGVTGERAVEPLQSYAFDELAELARTGLDFTALGRAIIITGEREPVHRLPAELTDSHFDGEPRVSRDGLSAATRAAVQGDGVRGTAGSISPLWGQLDVLAKEDGVLDQRSADRAAASRVMPPPVVVRVPDGVKLAADAPCALADLVPGATGVVRIEAGMIPAVAAVRLLRMKCGWDATGGTETVSVSLAQIPEAM